MVPIHQGLLFNHFSWLPECVFIYGVKEQTIQWNSCSISVTGFIFCFLTVVVCLSLPNWEHAITFADANYDISTTLFIATVMQEQSLDWSWVYWSMGWKLLLHYTCIPQFQGTDKKYDEKLSNGRGTSSINDTILNQQF